MGCAETKEEDAAPVSVEHEGKFSDHPLGSKESAAFLFKRLDTDGDGKISAAEFQVVSAAISQAL